MVGWLRCRLFVGSVGWLVGCLVGWLVVWWIGCSGVAWLLSWLCVVLFGRWLFVVLLVGVLVGWLVGTVPPTPPQGHDDHHGTVGCVRIPCVVSL